MREIDAVISTAQAEIGYLEKKTNVNLDDKTANAGYNNYTKYARDLDNIPGFYNGRKNGYAWCDVFVDWCFVKALGVERAKELLCQPNYSLGAGVDFSLNYYKQRGQYYTSPKIGDQIFFRKGNSITHTGLVYAVDSSKVYTIEGNTSATAGVVANGGSVQKKSYSLSSSYIAGYGRPKYKEEATQPNNNVIKEEDFEMAKTYKNGSTPENVYADTGLTKLTGSLNRYEQCECLAIVNGRYLVKYRVDGTNNYKCGFVKYSGGVK